jgi:hypothetical protein
MTSGKYVDLTIDKGRGHWLKEYFDAAFEFAPGTSWRYVSENQYVLAAILHRATGEYLPDYLKPRLFEPLGITRDVFWETDDAGVAAGGWGLYLTTEEMLRFMLLFHQKGMYGGKRVLSEAWVRAASTFQSDSSPRYQHPDSASGYGYCLWLCGVGEAYRADGLFSQLGIVFPEYGAVLVATNCSEDEQDIRDRVWKHFPGVFCEASSVPPTQSFEIPAWPPLPQLARSPRCALEKNIEGKVYRFAKDFSPLQWAGFSGGFLPLPVVQMSYRKGGNVDDLSFFFDEAGGTMAWREGAESNKIRFNMQGERSESPLRLAGIPLTAVACAAWADNRTLEVWMRTREALCEKRLRFKFSGDRVFLSQRTFPDMRVIAREMASTLPAVVKDVPHQKFLQFFFRNCIPLTEPVKIGTCAPEADGGPLRHMRRTAVRGLEKCKGAVAGGGAEFTRRTAQAAQKSAGAVLKRGKDITASLFGKSA